MSLVKQLLGCVWESSPRKPKKDFKGDYSELLAAGRLSDFPNEETHKKAIEHNKKVSIDKCGFDKVLLEKLQRNGMEVFGDLRTHKVITDKEYTHTQRANIGAFFHDAWV